MYEPIKLQPSCAQAWVAASRTVAAVGGGAYNVVIDVADPLACDALDAAIIGKVDQFVRGHGRYSVTTVANTIFPEAFARTRTAAQLYQDYPDLHRRMRQMTGDWGRYFDRMICWPSSRGGTVNQLDRIVRRVKRQRTLGKAFRSIYDVGIHDPSQDTRWRGGPCLSLLSFKRDGERLLLTATYRNHHYVARCLGNLIGLGRLMSFVAREAGLSVGPLTCVSTYAEIDNGTEKVRQGDRKGERCGWRKKEAFELVQQCEMLLQKNYRVTAAAVA